MAIGLAATLGIGMCLGAASAVHSGSALSVMLGEPSESEKLISDALHDSIVPSGMRMWVDCQSEDDYSAPNDAHIPHELLTDELLPVANVRQEICDGVIAYQQSQDKSNPPMEQVLAVDTLVHEWEHVRFDSEDEAATSCRAFQEVDDFAVSLGATLSEAAELRRRDREVYFAMRPAKYRTDECVDGGPFDLDPATPGAFPYIQGFDMKYNRP